MFKYQVCFGYTESHLGYREVPQDTDVQEFLSWVSSGTHTRKIVPFSDSIETVYQPGILELNLHD